MNKISAIIDDIDDELEGAQHYAEKYVEAKERGDHAMAERYRSMTQDELDHALFLHDHAEKEVEKLREKFVPTPEMQSKFDEAHNRYFRTFEWIKNTIENNGV